MAVAIYWLIFAVLCFAFEAFGVTGVGLFFAGLGAVSLAVLMQTGFPGELDYILQFACFFGFTALWAALLWKPIKNYRMRRKSTDYSNIVGDRAVVMDLPLVKHAEGRVRWSGTVMIAELAAGSAHEAIAVGEPVIVKEAKGNKLIVDKT